MQAENRGHVIRYGHERVLDILSKKHGERFDKYRLDWERAIHEHTATETPLFIEIGVNSDCNLKCKMCARAYDNSYNNKHENMSLALVDKIVEQCKGFKLPALLVGQDSECLLCPDIKEIVRRLRQIGAVDFFFITNGTLLTEEMSEFLLEGGIDRLQISIDAATPETYKKIRGGNLEILEKNINNFLKIRNQKGLSTPILRLSFCQQKENEGEEEAFRKKWEGKADIVDFQKYIDLSNINHIADREQNREYFCPDPFQRIVIDYKGNMFGCCCIGYNRYFKLGNLEDMSIMEAWNSDAMKKLRESFLTQNLSKVCLNCRAGIERQ